MIPDGPNIPAMQVWPRRLAYTSEDCGSGIGIVVLGSSSTAIGKMTAMAGL